MENRFISGVSKPLFGFLTLVVVGLFFITTRSGNYFLFTVPILLGTFLYALTKQTWYSFQENSLEIKAGAWYKLEIPYAEIRKIKPSNSIESAPANSFDRLELNYGKFGRVIISPEDKEGFIIKLREMAPQVEVIGIKKQ